MNLFKFPFVLKTDTYFHEYEEEEEEEKEENVNSEDDSNDGANDNKDGGEDKGDKEENTNEGDNKDESEEDEELNPDDFDFGDDGEKKNDDDDVDDEDKKVIKKVVSNETKELRDKLEVAEFIRANPEYARYEKVILKGKNSTKYSSLPASDIAAIVSIKDQQAIGARKEREAQERAEATRDKSHTVRPTNSGKTDWTKASKEEYDAKYKELMFKD